MAVVARAEGKQRYVLSAGVLEQSLALLDKQLRAFGSDRPVYMACLTEATAAHTAAEQLKVYPVVHDLCRGHDGFKGEMYLVKIGDNAFLDSLRRAVGYLKSFYSTVVVQYRSIKARDINSAYLSCFFQEFFLCPAVELCFMQHFQQLIVHLLALAEQEDVDKIRHRLRIKGGGASGYHKRQQLRSVGTVYRHSRHVHHVQNGGIGHLIAYRECEYVVLGDRVSALKGVQRHIRLFHFLIHISPRGINALAPDVGQLVHGRIQDAHAEVGHTYLVGIRKTECYSYINVSLILYYLIVFAAGIARRLLHLGKYAFKSFIH